MKINIFTRIGAFLLVLCLFLTSGVFFGLLIDKNWSMLVVTTVVGVTFVPFWIKAIKELIE